MSDWEGQQQGEEHVDEQAAYDDEEEDMLDMGDDVETDTGNALLMRFCPNDSSMLYPQVSGRNR